MIPELKGRGLFVFSDPGGAKPILSFVKLKHSADSRVISDRVYQFTPEFGVGVESFIQGSEDDIIRSFNPDFIFTGTSYTSDIELKFISAAHRKGIPSYAFIDHYTSFRERFTRNNTVTYPDVVCLLDTKALDEWNKLNNGVPAMITGNYYHEYLKNWQPSISKNEFLNRIGLAGEKRKLVLYAPDPISNINGYPNYGFDEISATLTLNEKMAVYSRDMIILLKPHPNQDRTLLTPFLAEHFRMIDSDADLNTMIYYSDLVIGFFSNFLLEAVLLKKKVLRFIPSAATTDPFHSMNIGTVVDEHTLPNQLEMLICRN